MSAIYEEFWEWVEYDEEGYLVGVKDDSPKEIKDQYEKWVKKQEQNEKDGIKV